MAQSSSAYKFARCVAVVPAAGSGSRLGTPLPKALIKLGDKTIIERTLSTLVRSPYISHTMVLAPASHLREVEEIASSFKAVSVRSGGRLRSDSVRVGIEALRALEISFEYILVHDAARCLVKEDLISRTIERCFEVGAVTAAIPAIDTIKEIDLSGCVVKTLRRDSLVSVQTPQVFRRELLERAHSTDQPASAVSKDRVTDNATDDASIVEQYHPVYVIEGELGNFKITTPHDLAIAKILLEL